jgi:hypothetical protein
VKSLASTVSLLRCAVLCWPQQAMQEAAQGRALLIPMLRTLGNIAAGGGAAACAQLLSPESAAGVQARTRVLTGFGRLVTRGSVRACTREVLGTGCPSVARASGRGQSASSGLWVGGGAGETCKAWAVESKTLCLGG